MFNFILNLLFLLILIVIANAAYKGRDFVNSSWKSIFILSAWFILCSFILLGNHYHQLFIIFNPVTLSIFGITSLLWFIFPKLIRIYGKYPHEYVKNNTKNTRFMARFEHRSMTVKYFEILFQQANFLFLIFVVLAGLSTHTTILIFTLIVALIHLGNLFFLERKWAMFYFFISIPMAFLFSWMIINGFVLITATIHIAFYLVFNARYWFGSKQNNSIK